MSTPRSNLPTPNYPRLGDPSPQTDWGALLHELEQLLVQLSWPEWINHALATLAQLTNASQITWAQRARDQAWQVQSWPATQVDTAQQLGTAQSGWELLTQQLTVPHAPVWFVLPEQSASAPGYIWQLEDGHQGLFQLHGLPQSLSAESDLAQCLAAVAELAADSQRRHCLGQVGLRSQQIAECWQRSSRWQEHETLARTALAVATEFNVAWQADRVTICLDQAPSRWKLVASSGVAKDSTNTELAQQFNELGRLLLTDHAQADLQLVVAGQVPSAWQMNAPDTAIKIEQWWQQYVDQFAAQGIVVIPWRATWTTASETDNSATAGRQLQLEFPARLAFNTNREQDSLTVTSNIRPRVGLLIAEWYRPVATTDQEQLGTSSGQHRSTSLLRSTDFLLRSAVTAMEQARLTAELPGIGLARHLANWRGQGFTLGRVLGLLGLGLLIALLCWPVDFRVTANGRAWPVERREVFAPEDAIVQRVLVEHGAEVKADGQLLELVSLTLDQQRVQLRGELSTAEQRLLAIKAERLRLNGSTTQDLQRAEQLTAEESELQAKQQSWQAQLAIVEQRRAALQLSSPIQGQVLTWNVKETLQGQPVMRGQPLLTVANAAGAWQTEVRIPVEVLGYVKTASTEQATPLDVEIRSALAPHERWSGQLTTISQRNEVDPVWGTGALALTTLHDSDASSTLSKLSPGVEVRVQIPCGQRAWGFVLFRDLIDAFRRWW